MKKIYRVIYQEILPPTFIALAVLTFVVFTREFGRLAELLIRKNADALIVIEVIISLLPNILIYTVPISFLVGTLIGLAGSPRKAKWWRCVPAASASTRFWCRSPR